MKAAMLAAVTLLSTIPFATHAADSEREVVNLIEEYLRLWNAGDAAAITSSIYRFDAPHPFATKEGLQKQFDALKSAGYSHSDTLGIKACWINETQALVDLRYVRMKTDGTFMPPKERRTLYFVKKSDAGLRINNLVPMNAGTDFSCSSAQ
jgi:hypothetical protein